MGLSLSSSIPVKQYNGVGAPTTGSWTVGTLVQDNNHNLYLCTQSGSPGTWNVVSGDNALTAPLTLPAATGAPLKTEGGNTLDNGSGGTSFPTLTATLFSCTDNQTDNLSISGNLQTSPRTPTAITIASNTAFQPSTEFDGILIASFSFTSAVTLGTVTFSRGTSSTSLVQVGEWSGGATGAGNTVLVVNIPFRTNEWLKLDGGGDSNVNTTAYVC